MIPRLQFSISNLLWATTWTAIGLGAWAFLFTSPVVETYPIGVRIVGTNLCLIALAVSPFAAIGALLGNMRRGLMIGGILALIASILLLSMVTLQVALASR